MELNAYERLNTNMDREAYVDQNACRKINTYVDLNTYMVKMHAWEK